MLTKQQITATLKHVLDPELQINVIDLGLIYDIKVTPITPVHPPLIGGGQGGVKVFILMTLTSPGCPLADMFDDLIGGAIRQLEGVKEVNLEITFDPPWNMDMMTAEAKAELGMF